jgi:hypothetical protein
MTMGDHTTDKLLLFGIAVAVLIAAAYTGNERILDGLLLVLGAFVKALAGRVDPEPAAAAKTSNG